MVGPQATSPEEIQHLAADDPVVAFYFSGADCGVCRSLLPRLQALLTAEFPRIPLIIVDTYLYPAAAAQLRVFTVPTLLIFIEGRESIRRSSNFSPNEVAAALARPYALLFEQNGQAAPSSRAPAGKT